MFDLSPVWFTPRLPSTYYKQARLKKEQRRQEEENRAEQSRMREGRSVWVSYSCVALSRIAYLCAFAFMCLRLDGVEWRHLKDSVKVYMREACSNQPAVISRLVGCKIRRERELDERWKKSGIEKKGKRSWGNAVIERTDKEMPERENKRVQRRHRAAVGISRRVRPIWKQEYCDMKKWHCYWILYCTALHLYCTHLYCAFT